MSACRSTVFPTHKSCLELHLPFLHVTVGTLNTGCCAAHAVNKYCTAALDTLSTMPSLSPVLLSCLATLCVAASQQPVRLSDSTFEDATQAATGQTTGNWQAFVPVRSRRHCLILRPASVADRLVLFTCPRPAGKTTSEELSRLWGDLAEDAWQNNPGYQVAEVLLC